jgi:hypothetical protein
VEQHSAAHAASEALAASKGAERKSPPLRVKEGASMAGGAHPSPQESRNAAMSVKIKSEVEGIYRTK